MNPYTLLLALILTVSVGTASGYLGTLMLSKRMSLVGDPLSHLALPGITLALIYGWDVSIGAFATLITGIILIWLLEKKTRLPTENLIAIVFSLSVAVTFIYLPYHEIEIALIGNLSKLTPFIVFISVILSSVAFILVKKIYRKMVLISISEDLAKSEKINVENYNLIYLLTVALIVGLGVRFVGSLLTAAIVSIPAATSRNLSRNMTQYAYGGALAGGLAAVLGLIFFYFFSIPIGPSVVIASGILFLVSVILKKNNN